MKPAARIAAALAPWLAVAPAVALAACAAAPPPGAGGIPSLTIRSRVIGRAADYVEVTAAHRTVDYRVERIVLIAPDGSATEPEQVQRERIRDGYDYGASPRASLGVGGFTGSHSGVGVGLGIGFPLVLGRRFTGPVAFITRATIKVPAPAAYRAEPRRWKVAVHMRHRKTGLRVITEPAPRL